MLDYKELELSVSEASKRLERTVCLDDGVETLRFVTPKRSDILNKLGIKSVRDLFWHVPYRYLDFSKTRTIALCDIGMRVSVVGVVDKIITKNPKPKLNITEVYIADQTGILRAVFFRQPWIKNQIHEGDTIVVGGSVEMNFGFKQMNSPFFEVLDSTDSLDDFAKVLPIHSTSEGLSAAWLRRIISQAIYDSSDVCDYLPSKLVALRHLMNRNAALSAIHFPSDMHEQNLARRRFAFDELFLLQIALRVRNNLDMGDINAFSHTIDGFYATKLEESLPFKLTDEQSRALSEIAFDMHSTSPMNRLLLGDVGTGKTAVSAVCMAMCKDSGTQAALMAPTSVLATQHANKLIPLFEACGIKAALVLGSTPKAQRQEIARKIKSGEIDVVFGTTALLSSDIKFKNLSLVVIDEQHRFGVEQRAELRNKGEMCDLLAMSATPIPRTLALSIYGDMETSIISHKPIEGVKTTTKVLAVENEDVAFKAIENALYNNHQAYVVCPVIDDSDTSAQDMQGSVVLDPANEKRRLYSATICAKRFEEIFPGKKVGLLHGRMSALEKDQIMEDFCNKEIDILVSTTVIEVGVDVANATVMLIYDSDRFGLATLHQLRGRVGRGKFAGEVYLVTPLKQKNPARKRLSALEKTTDGFKLAQFDLEQRHEGEVFGYRQHGGVSLKCVDMIEDADLIEFANQDAKDILRDDPQLISYENRAIRSEVEAFFDIYFKETRHI